MFKTLIKWLLSLLVVIVIFAIFGGWLIGIAFIAIIIVVLASPSNKIKQNEKL